jgi:hypothetical protein
MIADILGDFAPEELEAAGIFLPALQRVADARITTETIPEK